MLRKHTACRGEEYFNIHLRLGDVIRIYNTEDKNGDYIIFSDEKCGTWLRPMCPLVVSDNGDYKYIAGYSTQGLQVRDHTAYVEVLGNILEDYKGTLNIINITNKMTKLTTIIKALTRKEPEKTFVSVGFMDEQENITNEGREALEYILWNANKDSLMELAKKLEEDKQK